MSKKSNINFGKKKQKANLNKIAITVIATVLVVFVGFKVVGATTSYLSEKKEEKILVAQQAEAERIAAEKKRKEEEEAKKKIVGVKHDAKQYSYDARKVSEKLSTYDYTNNGEKVVFLTFDDGASTTVTPQVLDTLKANDVKATFFVTGQNIERGGKVAEDLIKRTFNEGNAIANHSYSHDYKYLYPNRTLNLENFTSDFAKTDEMLKKIISPYFSTRVIRCPGGHMSWNGMDTLDTYLDEKNMASIDWNALNADAEGKKKSAPELVEYVKQTSEGKEMVVVLMHDTYGKDETAKALPEIIKYFKDNGYAFKTLS
ncbi:MAG: polysaccharide deacetylase family protein [Romboutsia sp.]|uniref:polysaccharide deacetylase family protein n=1 Tax=Romboutsia sp. TaxID=1965302 RepID=UPI003F310AB6